MRAGQTVLYHRKGKTRWQKGVVKEVRDTGVWLLVKGKNVYASFEQVRT